MTGRASKKYANVWKTQFGGSKMRAILQDVQSNKSANKQDRLYKNPDRSLQKSINNYQF